MCGTQRRQCITPRTELLLVVVKDDHLLQTPKHLFICSKFTALVSDKASIMNSQYVREKRYGTGWDKMRRRHPDFYMISFCPYNHAKHKQFKKQYHT